MDGMLLELLPYVRQGHNCAQILLAMAMRAAGEEESDGALMQAARGLGFGIGQSGGPCGLLSGGALALTWLARMEDGQPHAMLDAMLNDYALWFMERVADTGYGCDAIRGGGGGELSLEVCGNLLCECWEKMLEIGEAYALPRPGY